MRKLNNSNQLRCDCGKLIAIVKPDGTVTVKCRGCGRIIPLIVTKEPRADRAKSR